MSKPKTKPCLECKGTGKLVYSNTGFENDCMYCNGFGKVLDEST
jgi:DnaJ-class molecular chaperone